MSGITTTFTSTHDIDLHGCGESIAAASDHNSVENVKPFLFCSHICSACVPIASKKTSGPGNQPVGSWYNEAKSAADAEESVLTEESYFLCETGAKAKVEFVDAGQNSIRIGDCDDSLIDDRLNSNLDELSGDEEAKDLLRSGKYNNILTNQGALLDLDNVEEINDGDDNVVVQTIYDPVVADKQTIVDDFSVVVVLPKDIPPQQLLEDLAYDADGVLPDLRTGGNSEWHDWINPAEGGPLITYAERKLDPGQGDFRIQSTNSEVGSITEIDVPGPINANVINTELENGHFIFQTIELNGEEHPLHGSREFGYEEIYVDDEGNTKVRFYTRAVATPDIGLAGLSTEPERRLWSDFTNALSNYAEENGGIGGEAENKQYRGPTGNELWRMLPQNEQIAIKSSQINGLQREIDRLRDRLESINRGGHGAALTRNRLNSRISDLENELEDWMEIEITGSENDGPLAVVSGATLTCPKAVLGSDFKFYLGKALLPSSQ